MLNFSNLQVKFDPGQTPCLFRDLNIKSFLVYDPTLNLNGVKKEAVNEKERKKKGGGEASMPTFFS